MGRGAGAALPLRTEPGRCGSLPRGLCVDGAAAARRGAPAVAWRARAAFTCERGLRGQVTNRDGGKWVQRLYLARRVRRGAPPARLVPWHRSRPFQGMGRRAVPALSAGYVSFAMHRGVA